MRKTLAKMGGLSEERPKTRGRRKVEGTVQYRIQYNSRCMYSDVRTEKYSSTTVYVQ